jgi:alpha-1,2-mannosyltransferase
MAFAAFRRSPYPFVLAFFLLVGAVVSASVLISNPFPYDFPSFYGASTAVKRGLNPYDFDVLMKVSYEAGFVTDEDRLFPYLYPPFLAYAFAWLPKLGLEAAITLWRYLLLFGTGLSSVFTIRAVMASYPGEDAKIPLSLLGVAAFLTFVLPLQNNLFTGQSNNLVLAFLSAAVMLSVTRRDLSAGFVLAFAVAIKVTPIFLALPWALERRWRALAGLAVGLLVTVLITVPFGGASVWLEFLHRLPQMSHGATVPGLFPSKAVWNFALAGFFARISDSQEVVRAASIISILVLLALVTIAWLRSRALDRYQRMLLPLIVLMIIGSPLAYSHHVIYLLPPLLLELHRAFREDRRVRAGALVVLSAIASCDFPILYPNPRPAPIWLSVNLYALLALYGMGVWSLLRDHRDRQSAGM